MRSNQSRQAMTLIELLVVVGLIVILMSLAAMVIPALRANNDSVKAATQMTAALSLSKQQALRDQAPRGIRLLPDPTDPTVARSFQYIELPPAVIPTPAILNGIALPMTLTVSRGVSAPNVYTATLAGARHSSNWVMYGVEVGDFLIITESGQSYVGLITGFANSTPSTPSDTLQIYALSRNFPPLTPMPRISMDGFKVLRKPRPLVGEDVVQLPKGMVIDLGHSALTSLGATNPSPWPWSGIPNVLDPQYDILFLPSGEISGSPHGVITLLMRAEDNPSDLGKMTLVAVYTRTGQIIMHPVAAGGAPYAFLTDGQGSGL